MIKLKADLNAFKYKYTCVSGKFKDKTSNVMKNSKSIYLLQ
jgi:hypothetical protein